MKTALFTLTRSATVAARTFAPAGRSSLTFTSLHRTFCTSSVIMSSSNKLVPADRVKNEKDSVWVEFIQLAMEHKPLNLGQGFPDFAAPQHVTQALANATLSENVLLNQYTRGFGHPRLVQALSTLYSRLINRPINAQNEILVTAGAYEGLYCAILGLVNPGDEVIIVEPFFDCYEPMVKQAGGVPKFVPYRLNQTKLADTNATISSADWILDPVELEAAFNQRTKMIILNTPHNPLGKVMSRQELEFIGQLCRKYDVIALMDEVYEWLVFDHKSHVRMASLPDMWERTITVGSAGKTFSVTGWKLGWAYGPKALMRGLQMVHSNTLYVCPTPTQEAVAVGFETELARFGSPDSYWVQLANDLQRKRDKMAAFLTDVGMRPTVPEGGYFMLADFSALEPKIDFSSETDPTKDYRFVKWMTKNRKLQGIPPSAFYSEANKALAQNYVRYCFIKKDETLDEAEKIFKQIKNTL